MKTERLLIRTGSLCLVSFDFLIMTSHMHDHATVFKKIEITFILVHILEPLVIRYSNINILIW